MKTYPLVSDYKNAIIEQESFATLSFLEPCYVGKELYFATGGPAVVFKMKSTEGNKYYAIKCFIKEQNLRQNHFEQISNYLQSLDDNPYFVNYSYYDSEIWVNDAEYPILQMPWIEGKILSSYISELCENNDTVALQDIANNFDKMALWLLNQNLAHGDLKPDNIIVTLEDELMLVDYDEMFVPSLQGSKSLELGTKEYRHPKRSPADFNQHLDDFPILVLSLSLHALAKDPTLYTQNGSGDALLFQPKDYENLLLFPHLSFFQQNAENEVLYSRFSMLIYSVTQPIIKLVGLKELLEVTAELVDDYGWRQYVNGVWQDKYGVEFSCNKTALYTAPDNIIKYIIPDSVTEVGDAFVGSAFSGCSSLSSIHIPDSVTYIGDSAFEDCSSLTNLHISNSITTIKRCTFNKCSSLKSIHMPDSVITIGICAFSECTSLRYLSLPNSIREIGGSAFAKCSALVCIDIPNSVTEINMFAFMACSSLKSLYFPKSVSKINNSTCNGCASLTFIHIPDSVVEIGQAAFKDCSSLTSIHIPNSITQIDEYAFEGCTSLTFINIPYSVLKICKHVFKRCSSLTSVKISNPATKIENHAFEECILLNTNNINMETSNSKPLHQNQKPKKGVIDSVFSFIFDN